MVMLTLRTLQDSRAAMHSVVARGSVKSSLSHRRPRAIDAIKTTRVSDRRGWAR